MESLWQTEAGQVKRLSFDTPGIGKNTAAPIYSQVARVLVNARNSGSVSYLG